ncbi:uroporphyrinogen-III synthase [Cellulomonas denverensis]|uniref:Uroporphyrinogen-III synthase n=1 Tax=Cellulomonas denverensis TaxID=264297 RepID=A0A7X6R0U7_9CELL|nr:uroporphyrinogen-III synthase [Cellulomonas denverensis]NKY24580.1 uroporphyrinogen-III synthase [Cellulomonas denverensis]GIG27067.1 uroporphyrinogen III methyltransferase [Cellulomonas denverensis]
MTADTGLVPAPQGPLTGLRVLVPRQTEGPDPLVIALLAAGAEPVVVPLIQTVPPEDPTELDDTLLAVQAGYYGWVGITSAAAVPVLADRAEETGTALPELLSGVQVAAVGGSTARALRSAGVRVDVVPTGQSSATTLLRVWPAVDGQPEPRRVLLPLGDLAADTLAGGLRAHGWAVDVVTTYRTVPGPMPEPDTRQEWAAGRIDAALLTSGSTARNLIDLLGPAPDGVRLVCIGDSTATEALRAGLTVSAVAAEQSPSGLVAALIATMSPDGEVS